MAGVRQIRQKDVEEEMKPEDYPIPANATEEQKRAWKDYLKKTKEIEDAIINAVDKLLKNGAPCDREKK